MGVGGRDVRGYRKYCGSFLEQSGGGKVFTLGRFVEFDIGDLKDLILLLGLLVCALV